MPVPCGGSVPPPPQCYGMLGSQIAGAAASIPAAGSTVFGPFA